jgi:cytochrome c biogenesis protein CcmG, thiol:disulfide interchange protein DsbE
LSSRLAIATACLLILVACGGQNSDVSEIPDLPIVEAVEFEAMLAGVDQPAVVNVWASWCIPCRSEAPLLTAAHQAYRSQIEFIGVDVQDTQAGAKAFIAEFGIQYDNLFDRTRTIPARYGGIGVPITFFFAPGGKLVGTHNGIIDERTLAIGIDELLRFEG